MGAKPGGSGVLPEKGSFTLESFTRLLGPHP
jgi:hypothetical protein